MTDFVCAYLDDSFEEHVLHHLHRMEIIMTGFANDQAHLDADVTAETTDLATIVAELKAQHAAGQPLDFTKADALVASMQTEATADAPVTPPVTPPPSTTPPAPTTVTAPTTPPITPPAPAGSDPNNTPPVTPPTAPVTKTLYEHTSTNTFDPNEWPPATVKAADGVALYTFAGDTAPGDAKGTGADWTVYTGATQPA